MSLVSGIVHQIDDGTVRTGRSIGKPYKNIILTTGNKLSAFDLSFVAGVEVGKEYTFPIETSGQYVNIVGEVVPVIQTEEVGRGGDILAKHAEAFLKPVYEHVEKNIPKIHPTVDKDTAIRKAVALKASVEFIVGQSMKIGENFSVGNVIETAKKFEEYLK